MKRPLLAVALLVGCGKVENPAGDAGGPIDGPGPGVDAGSGAGDLLTGTLRDGCMVALHMDEPSWSGTAGEVKDDCGNDNPGTASGPGTNTVAGGVRGRAGSFAGGGCIEIPNASTLHATTGLTMSAWVFPTAIDGGINNANGIISKRVDTNNQSEYGLSLWLRNHVWAAVDGDAEPDRLEGTVTITTQRWIQLTLVYDGTQLEAQRMRLYLNGSLDTTHRETSATLTAYNSVLHIGCMPAPAAGTQQNFVGQIDEVVLWNRALSEAEIMQWYTSTRP